MNKKLKIAGLILTLIPTVFLLLIGMGELAGGMISGIQHLPEFIILTLLIFWSWKKPKTGGLGLIIIGLLFALVLGKLAYNDGTHIETRFIWGILILALPVILGGFLFYFSQKNNLTNR